MSQGYGIGSAISRKRLDAAPRNTATPTVLVRLLSSSRFISIALVLEQIKRNTVSLILVLGFRLPHSGDLFARFQGFASPD